MQCPSCGNTNADSARFCTRCGTPLLAAAPAAPPADLPPTIVVPILLDQKQQVASYWHTLLVVLIMLAVSASGQSRSKRVLTAGFSQTSRPWSRS